MNKDVIYIEPEDDITDIIGKIESSKEKIVALVPPKKAGVLRSIVNIKLIVKSGASAGKKVVLVTTDPSILKLAAATKLPVTKDLQSAPAIPKLDETEVAETQTVEEVVEKTDEDGEKVVVTEEVEEDAKAEGDEKVADTEIDKNSEENDIKDKKDKKAKKQAKGDKEIKNPVLRWVAEHKKLCIFGGVGLVMLILVAVWAFVIAPAAVVTVGIRTTTSNFSENVTFTDILADENASEGKFYLIQQKMESKAEVEFEATGQKNVGEKAKGSVVVWAFFPITGGASSTTVKAGDTFSLGELSYVTDEDTTISWDGDLADLKNGCSNGNNSDSLRDYGCLIYGKVAVTASEPGTSYNIEPSNTGWKAPIKVAGAYSDSAMAGGTDDIKTIVQQSDIDEALKKMETSDEKINKEKLFDQISDSSFIIEASFKQTVGEAVSTPKVGEEVEKGKKAKLSVVTTDSVYYVDKTKVEEFIAEKAKLSENFKIYSMNDPFVENFTKTDGGYSGKLKTSYVSGPKVTENDVIEIIKGKGLGTAQHDLKDINGISSIRIDVSYPWVSAIPNDPEKITVILDVEE